MEHEQDFRLQVRRTADFHSIPTLEALLHRLQYFPTCLQGQNQGKEGASYQLAQDKAAHNVTLPSLRNSTPRASVENWHPRTGLSKSRQ